MINLPGPCGPEHDWYWPAFAVLILIGLVVMIVWDAWKR